MKTNFRKLLWLALVTALTAETSPAHAASTGSFTLVGSMNQSRRLHTSTLLTNGKVLVAGGTPFAQATVSELYDPEAQVWTISGALNAGREFHTATLLPDGTVAVVGGQTANRLLTSTEIYNAKTGLWTDSGAMNEGRELHSATLLS